MRICTVLLVFCIGVSNLISKTIKVPQDHGTIQQAINAAVNGDTVLINEGTYFENLLLNKKIVLASFYIIDNDTSHISKTIIDGSTPHNTDSASVIYLGSTTDTTTVITGFTIQGGKGNVGLSPDNVWWRRGGGIHSDVGGSARIVKNIITKNSVVTSTSPTAGNVRFLFGGGIALWPTGVYANVIVPVIIEENIIRLNNVQGTVAEAGGMVVANYVARIKGNIIENNTAVAPTNNFAIGGISIGGVQGTIVELRENIVRGNTSSFDAGGVVIYSNSTVGGPVVTMSNNLIVKNSAGRIGGGIVIYEGCSLKMVNNTIADNIGSSAGLEMFGTALNHPKVVGINNIFWNPGSTYNEIYGPDFESFHHNLIRGESSFGENNFSADPKFLPDGSYRLSASSPCIAAGVKTKSALGITLDAPDRDLNGNVRPRTTGSAPDLGAIEEDMATITATPKNRAEVRKFTFNGAVRYYIVVRPKGLETTPQLPVLIGLHGYDGTADGELNFFRMHQYTDSIGFMMVYPEAFQRKWNSGIGDNPSWPTPTVNDVLYISTLIDSLHAQYAIDTNRVYVTGFSNGGVMVQRLAAQLSNRIRGGIALSSALTSTIYNNFNSTRPVPMMIVNGTSDVVFSFNGGKTGWFSIPYAVDFWKNKNNATTMVDSTFINGNGSDGSSVERYKYYGGTTGKTVWFYKVNGGGHVWPGCDPFPDAGIINRDVDIRSEILRFIMDQTVDVERSTSDQLPIAFGLSQNYPNPFNPSTTIRYTLPSSAHVKLTVYNMLGQAVSELVNEEQSAGWKEVKWNAQNYASGIYFYKIEAGYYVDVKKLMLLK